MTKSVLIELQMPEDMVGFHLPRGLDNRLQQLLDRQDNGEGLTPAEREEAEGLVSIVDLLSLLKLKAERHMQNGILVGANA